MIGFWITIPLELRLALLSLVGVALGAASNHVIYTYCWFPRPISPWGKPDEKAPPRRRSDRIPLLGWWGMRRESEIHGGYFWLRPLSIEIAMAIGVPAFYYYETQTGFLLPAAIRNPGTIANFEPWATQLFLSHAVMLFLMVSATFIDFDEQTIPDVITVPGTIFALLLASGSLFFCLPAAAARGFALFPVPAPFGPPWDGQTGLLTGLGIWTGWCFALADRRLILRKGFAKAVEFFCAGLVRYPTWKYLLAMWGVGLVLISIVFTIGGDRWAGLLSALVGLGVGGGVVWAIRVVAGVAMNVEALGFGDVTLMAMLGAFLGWQAAVLGFFLAPISAIVIVITYFLLTGESRVPFGPYLCAGTLLTVLFWDRLFHSWFLNNFAILGPFMLWLFIGLTGAMGAMLFFWRLIKESLLRP